MKKWLLLFFLLPFVVNAQHIDFNKAPYKTSFVHLLKAIQEKAIIDTLNTGYTTLQYHSFSSKGQFIKANHQQYFTDYLLFNLNFDKFSQEGIYNRENIKLYNVQTDLFFNNKSENYHAHLSLGYHKIKMDENGGILNFSFNFNDPLLNEVYLLSAENESKNRNHYFSQNFKLTDHWSFSNKFSILSNRRMYFDQSPNSGFYTDIYLDSIQTYDSLSTVDITNDFGISYKDFLIKQLTHSRKAHINNIDSTDYDLGLGLDYINDKFNLSFKSEFYRSSQLSLHFQKRFKVKSFSHLISINYNRIRTPIFTNSYSSNHFTFDNDFSNEKTLAATYSLKFNKFSFVTDIKRYSDYIFLDESVHFTQHKNSIIHSQNKLSFELNWKRLHTNHSLVYQYSDNKDIIRFPDFNYTSSLWLESNLFGDNLNTQIGADLNFFTGFYAKAYNPAMAKYHLQNSQFIGDVPLLSTFLNLNVHNMSINIKYRNLLSIIKENSDVHYFIPNYPNYPSTIQLSLIWKLNNSVNKSLEK